MINGKKLVALCTSRVYDPQLHGYIVRLNDLLKLKGYSLLVFTINSDIYWEEDRQATEKYVFDLIPYDYIDAVIIMDERIKSHKIASKIIAAAKEHDLPIIVADGHYPDTSCINYDYEKGFEMVVRHVIEDHKIRHPHMMAGHVNNEFSDRRIEVFKKVLKENDIPFDETMVSHGDFWADPCRVATYKLLERGDLPEAIICANDVMAITVTEVLSKVGYVVPDDVIVTGFDGYDEIYFTSPKVTTASCDVLLLADTTADIVIKSIGNGNIYDEKITPVFIPNESCGCPERKQYPALLRNWFKESFARHNDDNRVLQLIASSMQSSSDPGELVSRFESYKTEDLIAVIDRKCFERDINYFTDDDVSSSAKDFIIVYDSGHTSDFKPGRFKVPAPSDDYTEDVLTPAIRDRILELTENGYPLIFNSLDFMNRPFGFVCYFFRNYLISNYSNTMSVTNAISAGIGGYINIQYQRMLLHKMDEMYRHDPLTGLYNRVGFINDFKALRKKPGNRNKPVTVIMSDLDGLKYINDNFGHADGDSAIVAVADALFNSVPKTSLSTRFGGDEVFSVIIGECDPEQIISDINDHLDKYNRTSDKPYQVATSCGYVTDILNDDYDFASALKSADEQMYIIKNNKYSKRDQGDN